MNLSVFISFCDIVCDTVPVRTTVLLSTLHYQVMLLLFILAVYVRTKYGANERSVDSHAFSEFYSQHCHSYRFLRHLFWSFFTFTWHLNLRFSVDQVVWSPWTSSFHQACWVDLSHSLSVWQMAQQVLTRAPFPAISRCSVFQTAWAKREMGGDSQGIGIL